MARPPCSCRLFRVNCARQRTPHGRYDDPDSHLDACAAPRGRRILWLNVLTVVSAAILIGAEVFGAAFAGSWAFATLFELGTTFARVLDAIFLLIGAA